MTRADFRSADLDELTELWNRFLPARYRIDAELLRARTVDSPLFDWGASCLGAHHGRATGFVAVKRAAGALHRVQDPDVAHLCAIAFEEPEVGVDLLAHAKAVLRDRGHSRLVVGQDTPHLLPGCPADCQRLASFLLVEGFASGGQVFDLERDLLDYRNPAKPTEAELRPLRPADADGLRRLLGAEFSDRWRYEVLARVGQAGPQTVVGLFLDGRLRGMALTQTAADGAPIGGGVWRGDLGEGWGALGPIGVASAIRGRGFGDALLGAALEQLKAQGVRRCVIDWTDLVEFYRRHGFEPSRTYETLALRLDDSA